MKDLSTAFLQAAIIIVGSAVLALCAFALVPALFQEDEWLFRWLLIGTLAAAIPFYVALFQTFSILKLVSRKKAFSDQSVAALQYIQYSGFAISLIYISLLFPLHEIAQGEDAPGVLLMGIIIVFVATCVGVLTGVLEKLLRSAIKLKSENDLTV